jgi:hypothetical protein
MCRVLWVLPDHPTPILFQLEWMQHNGLTTLSRIVVQPGKFLGPRHGKAVSAG